MKKQTITRAEAKATEEANKAWNAAYEAKCRWAVGYAKESESYHNSDRRWVAELTYGQGMKCYMGEVYGPTAKVARERARVTVKALNIAKKQA